MKLHELVSEPFAARCDPCAEAVQAAKRRQPPYSRPVNQLRQVVIVMNEDGLAEYMFKYPDGRLGAVEDC